MSERGHWTESGRWRSVEDALLSDVIPSPIKAGKRDAPRRTWSNWERCKYRNCRRWRVATRVLVYISLAFAWLIVSVLAKLLGVGPVPGF